MHTFFLTRVVPVALLAALSGCGGAATQAKPPAPLTVSGSGSATASLETLARSAEDGIAFVGNGGVSSLTRAQLRRVFGKRPTVATLEARRYPFTHKIGVVFRAEPAVSSFVARLQGDKVRLRLHELGYAPLD